VQEEDWRIRWSMALQPDLSMLPDRSVFLRASGRVSLTATVGDVPGLLPGMWEEFSLMGGGEVEEGCYYKRHTRVLAGALSYAPDSGG
jgi:hypothetical protein